MIEKTLIRFERFELDPATRSLRRNGQPIPLGPKTFELLFYFVVHPRQVISKEQLLAALWPDTSVDERNLSQHVFLLRKALAAADPGQDQMVVTLPGKGYQFTAVVQEAPAELDEAAGGLRVQESSSAASVVVQDESSVETRTVRVGALAAAGRRTLPGRRAGRRKWWAAAGVAAAVLAGLAVWLTWGLWHPKALDHVLVVIADLDNSTGDATFDHTLNKVIQIDLQQSPYFTVVSEGRVRRALSAMGRKSDAPITAADVREVCQRLNAQVYLTPSIASLGSRYVVTLSANACSDGRLVGGRREDSTSKAGVLRALETVTSRIRRDVGESRASLKQFDRPLYLEKTSSLEALKAYSEAINRFGTGKMDEAVKLLEHAIELDPNFTTAYADLSSTYYNLGDSKRDKENITKAYSMLDGAVNERERLYITFRYNESVTGDLRAMLRTLEMWAATYPEDNLVMANLANHYNWIGQSQQSADAAVKSLQLNAALGIAPNGVTLEIAARAFKHLAQYDKSLEYYNTAVKNKSDTGPIHGLALQIAALRHDDKEVARQVAWARGTANESQILQQAAMAALADGKAGVSDDLFTQATSAARREHQEADLAVIDAYRTRILYEAGLTAKAKALADAFTADDIYMDRLFTEAEVGDPAQARANATRRQKESPQDTLVNVEYAPSVFAALALRAGKPAEAIEFMGPAEQYELRDPTIVYLRGQAYLAAGKAPEAAAEFRKLIDNPGIDDPLTPLHALAHLNLARALVLESKPAEARAEYGQFLAMWSNADTDLPPLKQARAEMQKLPAR